MEATPRIELGIKVLQTSALPLGYVALKGGAENEIRTRDPLLGKEVLYHWAISANMVPQHRIELWTQGFSVLCSTNWATEARLATRMGLEPTTSAVTGRHSNQLNHRATILKKGQKKWWALTGSNRWHSACKADALPAELSARMVTGGGIEPPIPPWKGGVLTAWPTGQSVVIHVGFEPTTPWLRVRCSTSWANGPWSRYLIMIQHLGEKSKYFLQKK